MLAYLVGLKIPKNLESARFGVKHFHHPDILQAVEELAPEIQLLQLIDAAKFSAGSKAEMIRLRAEEIQQELEMTYRSACQRLFTFPQACGTLLSRLAKIHPERVMPAEIHGVRHWKLFPPPYLTANSEHEEQYEE